jgi:DNA repair exonuclease SbcCD ATPase subunit
VEADIQRLQGAGREHVKAAAGARAEAAQLGKGLDRLKASECPTCGQTIREERRQEYRDDIEKLLRDAAVGEQTFERAQREVEAQIADLSAELADLHEQQMALSVERKTWAERERAAKQEREEQAKLAAAHQSAGERVQECIKGCASATQAVKTSEDEHAAERKAVAELEATEVVLGLKGVRAHVLGKALGGLERVANAWLSRLAGSGLALKLKPYSEKKAGGISDSISLEVEGAGGGFGYKASSGGERRRIDVALLLALAEVAQAAHGQAAGTLFFDEVFDALDLDGVTAVTEVLGELARDRAVVVISHSGALAESLSFNTAAGGLALSLRVEGGRLV